MVKKFSGPAGKKKFASMLEHQVLVLGDKLMAKAIANKAKVKIFKKNTDIIIQGNFDSDLFFILSGRVSILINGRKVAERGPGQHVGEMVIIEPSEGRSATVRVMENAEIARLTEDQFVKIANKLSYKL